MTPARIGLACALCGAVLLASAARATCTVSFTPVDFGTVDLSHDTDAVGGVSWTCASAPLSVSIDPGIAGGFAPRQLAFNANRLAYNLFLDAGHTAVWGDGTAGAQALQPGAASGSAPIFGRLFGGQLARNGPYSDQLIVTVSF